MIRQKPSTIRPKPQAHERRFSHPRRKAVLLICEMRGERDCVVVAYRDGEQLACFGPKRGTIEQARLAWAACQAELLAGGYAAAK